MFEVLAWCSAIQAGRRRHAWAPLLGSPQDDGVIHMRIVATPVEPLLVKPPPWWLPTQEDSLSDISQFVEMPTQVSPKYDINFDQLWSDAVSSSHAFIVAGRPYHHHHHWGRPLIETHLRQIERPMTTPDLGLAGHLGRLTARRRGRVRAGGSSIRSWIESCEEAGARARCTGCTPPPSPCVQRKPREELEPPRWSTTSLSIGGAWAAGKAGSVRLSRCRPSTLEGWVAAGAARPRRWPLAASSSGSEGEGGGRDEERRERETASPWRSAGPGEAPPGADLVVGGKKATPSSTSVRSPRQLYCCNIQEGSLHSFSVLQEKVHKKQHTASQKLQSLLAIEQIHS